MTTTSTLANEIAPSLIQLGGLEQFASIYAELNQLAATTPQSEPETRDIELLDIRLPEPEGECDLTLVTDSRLPEPEGECDLTLVTDSRLPEPEGECDLTLVTDPRLPEPEGECDLTLVTDPRLPEPGGECDLTLVTDSRLPEPEGECDLTLLQDSDTFWFNPSSTGDNAAAFFADGLAPDAAPIELLSELLLCFEDTDLAYDTPYTVVAEASVDQFSDFNLI